MKRIFGLQQYLTIGLSAGALFAPAGIAAQDFTPPADVARQAERIQEKAEEDFQEKAETFEDERRVAPTGEQIPLQEEGAAGAAGECVAVKQVDVKGMTLFKRSAFAEEFDALIGPCVGLAQIDALLRKITNHYIERGYVTSRAVIAPQDLNSGILEIVVFEGELTEVKPGSEDGPVQNSELSFALPGLTGNTLNLRDIEQGIDQITRLPSMDAKMDIEPGALQSTSNLIVNSAAKKFWLRPTVTMDNDGQLSTGRHNWGASLAADNLMGALDSWNVYYAGDLTGPRNSGYESYGGFFSIPFGYWTLSLGGGNYSYESVISGNGQEFTNDGDSWNVSAGIDRLIFRDSDTKISTSFGLRVNDTVNRIRSIRLSASSYRLATLNVQFSLQQKLGGGLLQGSAGLVRGLDIFGAESADFGPGGPSIDFRKLSGSVRYLYPLKFLGKKAGFTVQLRGQTTLDPVLPAQRFSLGGSSTIRGFRDDGISGRSGVFYRQQFNTELFEFPIGEKGSPKAKIGGFMGYDAGGVFARAGNPYERGFMQSSSIGLSMDSPYFGLNAFVSMPWSAPDFVRHKSAEFTINARFGF